MPVFLPPHEFETAIVEFRGDGPRVDGIRAVIRDAELPVVVNLRSHRLQGRPEHRRIRVVGWQQNGDFWPEGNVLQHRARPAGVAPIVFVTEPGCVVVNTHQAVGIDEIPQMPDAPPDAAWAFRRQHLQHFARELQIAALVASGGSRRVQHRLEASLQRTAVP